jgi:hypothetical protein
MKVTAEYGMTLIMVAPFPRHSPAMPVFCTMVRPVFTAPPNEKALDGFTW